MGTASTNAQVIIGSSTDDPHAGAILDLKGINKGLLLPRVKLVDFETLTVGGIAAEGSYGTARGMWVYNTNEYALNGLGVYVWDGSRWIGINAAGKEAATCSPYLSDETKFVDITVRNTLASTSDSLTLRFLTYNLGANPNLSPKQQMAYKSELASPAEDITVFGGLYQWGRKDKEHSLRCSKNDAPEFFSAANTLYNAPYNPDTDHKFVWGDNLSAHSHDWINPHVPTLWGNGNTVAGGGNSGVTKQDNDPCPSGFRVPTEHEWALLANEDGSSTSYTGDHLNLTGWGGSYSDAATSGITWVYVTEGKVGNSWTDNGKTRGYALYRKDVWNAADINYKNGTYSLANPDAPNPLMFLPAAGMRNDINCNVENTGLNGRYWSSVVDGDASFSFDVQYQYVGVLNAGHSYRAFGLSVRCISEY
jgi:hypothetical protein